MRVLTLHWHFIKTLDLNCWFLEGTWCVAMLFPAVLLLKSSPCTQVGSSGSNLWSKRDLIRIEHIVETVKKVMGCKSEKEAQLKCTAPTDDKEEGPSTKKRRDDYDWSRTCVCNISSPLYC